MMENRRATLETLVGLMMADDGDCCYGSDRAERLLRTQSSREELESFGIDEKVLERLWPRVNDN